VAARGEKGPMALRLLGLGAMTVGMRGSGAATAVELRQLPLAEARKPPEGAEENFVSKQLPRRFRASARGVSWIVRNP